MIDHVPPKPFPTHHLAGIAIPQDFARTIVAAADKDGVLFQDKLLSWARMGALCERIHAPKPVNPRRKR